MHAGSVLLGATKAPFVLLITPVFFLIYQLKMCAVQQCLFLQDL